MNDKGTDLNIYIANDLEEVKQLLEFNCYIEEI